MYKSDWIKNNVSLYLVVFCNENTKKSFERFERLTPVIKPTKIIKLIHGVGWISLAYALDKLLSIRV